MICNLRVAAIAKGGHSETILAIVGQLTESIISVNNGNGASSLCLLSIEHLNKQSRTLQCGCMGWLCPSSYPATCSASGVYM